MTCHRFPLLRPPRPRGLLGAGASIGPVRAIAIGCAVGAAIGGGVMLAKPPAFPAPAAPAPRAFEWPQEPIPIPAPPGVLLFVSGVAVLWGMRR